MFRNIIKNQSINIKELERLHNGFATYRMPALIKQNCIEELIERENVINDIINYNIEHLNKLEIIQNKLKKYHASYVLHMNHDIQNLTNKNKSPFYVNKNHFIEINSHVQHHLSNEIRNTKNALNKINQTKTTHQQEKENFELQSLSRGNYCQVKFSNFAMIKKYLQKTTIFQNFSEYKDKKNSLKTKQIENYLYGIGHAENLDKLFEVIKSDPVVRGIPYSMRENTKERGGWYYLFNRGQSRSDNYALALQEKLVSFIEKKFSVQVPDHYKQMPIVNIGLKK